MTLAPACAGGDPAAERVELTPGQSFDRAGFELGMAGTPSAPLHRHDKTAAGVPGSTGIAGARLRLCHLST